MKVNKLFFGLFPFMLWSGLFTSCEPSRQRGESTLQPAETGNLLGARLIQVDSIMIDVIGEFRVYDYEPRSGLFLGGDIMLFPLSMNTYSGRLGHVVFDVKGDVISTFNNANNGPTGFGPGAMDHSFLGPDAMGVISMKGLYVYDIDGNLSKSYRSINALDIAGASGRKMLFSADQEYVALGLFTGRESMYSQEDKLKNGKPLVFYELKWSASTSSDTVVLAKHGFPDHPIFSSDSKLSYSLTPPLMTLDHSAEELLTVYPEIPVMTRYDLRSGQVIEEINLAPKHFSYEVEEGRVKVAPPSSETMAWLNRGGRLANSRYHDIVQLGEYTLLRYSPALPMSAVNRLVSHTQVVQRNENWPGIRRQYYRFYYQLLKNGKPVISDFELPELEPRSGDRSMRSPNSTRGKIVGGNGLDDIFVFVPNTGDEERDYELIRVYKLDLY